MRDEKRKKRGEMKEDRGERKEEREERREEIYCYAFSPAESPRKPPKYS